jgi:hypothetical protein
MLVVSLVIVIVQVFFGEVVSGSATYPAASVQLNSIGDLITAMNSAAGPALLVHAFFGILVLLSVLGTAVIAVRYHKRSVTVSALLSLVSVVLAVLGGYVWASSDFSNPGGVILMVNGALGTFGMLFVTLYYTK